MGLGALSHERERPLFQDRLIDRNPRRQVRRPLANAAQPLAGLPRSPGEHAGALLAQPGNASVERVVPHRRGGLPAEIRDHLHRILKPLEQTRRNQRAIAQLLQARAQHGERAPQVAAVDTRHVTRLGRLQGAGIVPIVKVPPVSFQAQHGLQHMAGAIQQGRGRQIAQIVGRQARQQCQPDIRRAGAGSHGRRRIALHMVGRQPVVGLPREAIEVVPGLPGPTAELPLLGARHRDRLARIGQGNPPGDQRSRPATPAAPGRRPAAPAAGPPAARRLPGRWIRCKPP